MRLLLALFAGRTVSYFIRFFRLGAGSTWPGHIALAIDPLFSEKLSGRFHKIILIAGTNGKTTTLKIIRTLLHDDPHPLLFNEAGANLLNGIATVILNYRKSGNKPIGIFECDENAFPLLIPALRPDTIVLLNLFRDQLDRYGEINTIAKKWAIALKEYGRMGKVSGKKVHLVINADDPVMTHIAYESAISIEQITFFGKTEGTASNITTISDRWADSVYCPRCGNSLSYKHIFFSHLGSWFCSNCHFKRPHITQGAGTIPLPIEGIVNQYNAAAALLAVRSIGSRPDENKLMSFVPAFGRMEEMVSEGTKVKIILSKNPTGLNENIRYLQTKEDIGSLLIVLNDRIPDGQDISWIWDVVFENVPKGNLLIISGDRVYDLALRLYYAGYSMDEFMVIPDLYDAIKRSVSHVPSHKKCYVLPTYSAMLEVRKILTGKKLL